MSLRARVVVWFVAMVVSEGKVFAQNDRGAELGVYVGRASADAGIVQVIDARVARQIRTQVENDGMNIGLVVGGNFNDWIGAEMLASFATNNYFSQLTERGSSLSELDNNLFVFLMGNAVVHLAPGRVVPFISGGVGMSGTSGNTDRAYNFGGGLKIFVRRHVGIRVDARLFLQDLTDKLVQDVLLGGQLVPVPESYSERIRLTTLNVGITFVR